MISSLFLVYRCWQVFFLKMHFISVKEARCRPLAFPLCQACGMASAVGVRAPDGPSNAMGDFSWRWVSLKSKSLECHRLQRKMLLGWSDEWWKEWLYVVLQLMLWFHETWNMNNFKQWSWMMFDIKSDWGAAYKEVMSHDVPDTSRISQKQTSSAPEVGCAYGNLIMSWHTRTSTPFVLGETACPKIVSTYMYME